MFNTARGNRYPPVGSDIDTILKILIAWFEKFRSVSIIAKEYAASYTAALRCLYTAFLQPQKPQAFRCLVVHL